MRIRRIVIPIEISEKIQSKHKLNPIVAKEVFTEEYSRRYIRKVKYGDYMAIGISSRGDVTVFFSYEKGTAIIRSAYPSSDWQIDLYKEKIRR